MLFEFKTKCDHAIETMDNIMAYGIFRPLAVVDLCHGVVLGLENIILNIGQVLDH